MKNLIQYRFTCETAFFIYLKTGDKNRLIETLKTLEESLKENESDNRELWFKFGKSDSLATSINDINKDLSLPNTHSNHQYLIKCLELTIGINPDNELEIYFS